MMRIAYLCADLGIPYHGGKAGALHMRQTVSALANFGHEVCVFATGTNEAGETCETGAAGAVNSETNVTLVPLDKTTFSAQMRIRRITDSLLPQSRLHKDIRGALYSETFYECAMNILPQWKPDIIYERHSLWGQAGLKIARKLNVPHLLEINAHLSEETEERRGLTMLELAQSIERHVIEETDAAVCVSIQLAQKLKKDYQLSMPILTLPAGVDVESFRPDISPVSVRRKWNLEDKFVIGFAGSMKLWHGLDLLLEAFPRVLYEVPNACLFFVGNASTEQENAFSNTPVRERENIISAGQVCHDRMPEHLAAMDICVLPGSNQYGAPMKLFEYMAMRKPIIAPRLDVIQEVVTDNISALLFDEGDVDQLTRTLVRFAKNPKDADDFAGAARDQALEKHTTQRRAESLTQFAEEVIARHRNPGGKETHNSIYPTPQPGIAGHGKG
ncbi:MAG: glycosyltransferase family 4 protein [candidate division Zixibacteria bacterium]|nr:glycosyltransferase family 4 protein [candidate division Zixibacteria bacterium]